MNASLDDVRQLGEELRSLFAQERRAIAALDHSTLSTIASMKETALTRLHELVDVGGVTPECAPILRALRVDAQATSMLAATASRAVRVLLGYEQDGAYDRRARPLTSQPNRILASR